VADAWARAPRDSSGQVNVQYVDVVVSARQPQHQRLIRHESFKPATLSAFFEQCPASRKEHFLAFSLQGRSPPWRAP